MAYFPVVGRLDCESSSTLHRGFWQVNGYGIVAVYKSDWDRFGGMCIYIILILNHFHPA